MESDATRWQCDHLRLCCKLVLVSKARTAWGRLKLYKDGASETVHDVTMLRSRWQERAALLPAPQVADVPTSGRTALAAQLTAELQGYDWDDDDTSWARGARTSQPGESSALRALLGDRSFIGLSA